VDKAFFLKNKKILWGTLAVIFVLSLFFIKTKSVFKNEQVRNTGLVYSGNETVGSLIDRDTDGDGILNWEESLWGTDPTKIDTDGDGEPDGAEIAKMKGTSGNNYGDNTTIDEENLTETDKFSRELFSTVVTLGQAGQIDQNTIDKLSNSMVEQMVNPATKKVFSFSDIKTTPDSSVKAVQDYSNALNSIFKKSSMLFKSSYEGVAYEISKNFADVLQKYVANTEDASILDGLDPTIREMRALVEAMSGMNVPEEFLALHLGALNGIERAVENLSDIKLANSDPILAMGAGQKLEENINLLQDTINSLRTGINQKLNY
jgi:hypothetical protein